MTLTEALQINEIKWLKSKSQVNKPYPDMDFTEYTFNGTLPGRMAQKIKSTLKDHSKIDCTYTLRASDDETFENTLTIKFGKYRRTQNNIMFYYTEEMIS